MGSTMWIVFLLGKLLKKSQNIENVRFLILEYVFIDTQAKARF